MPKVEEPKVKVLALRAFLAGPGRVARPGEACEIDRRHAHMVIASGLARELTEAEAAAAPKASAPETFEVRDPEPTTRDPKGPRSKRG